MNRCAMFQTVLPLLHRVFSPFLGCRIPRIFPFLATPSRPSSAVAARVTRRESITLIFSCLSQAAPVLFHIQNRSITKKRVRSFYSRVTTTKSGVPNPTSVQSTGSSNHIHQVFPIVLGDQKCRCLSTEGLFQQLRPSTVLEDILKDLNGIPPQLWSSSSQQLHSGITDVVAAKGFSKPDGTKKTKFL
ncbi:hypothetical protein L1987_15676 [Smallanthus sonchifolius]|uniref:Uncharacterized protein n=1 Tax=Smallanthus sonchifolius TaxID=185202 RepID=A0ACB9J6L7_9ASTR|nr:hypothetical protein L1987_15676 [Smallanthus sonchifolius]